MRSWLDRLYQACGVLAAACLALIAALVVAQVAGRLGGVLVPGADEFAGFALVASSFLALASTLRAGTHIRVTLLTRGARPGSRVPLELWCLGFAAVVSGYFAYYVIEMVVDAFRFGEKSQGMLAIPLWLPQSTMALGIVALTIAFVDEFVRVLQCGTPSYPDDLRTVEDQTPPPPGGD